MAEYIERETAYEDFEKCNSVDPKWTPGRVKALIVHQKTADVAPVWHGRWVWHSEKRGYLCSECRSGCLLNYESDWHKSDWCPHCGAKMDGGSEVMK